MPATDQWLSLLQQTVNPALLHSSARPFLELLAPLSPPTTRYKAGEVEWRELSRGQAPGSDGHGARALSHWGGAPPAPQTAGAAEAADEEVGVYFQNCLEIYLDVDICAVIIVVIFSGWERPPWTPCGLGGRKVTWCLTWFPPPDLSEGRLPPRSRRSQVRLLWRFRSRRKALARTACGPGGGRATSWSINRQGLWTDVDPLNWEIHEILFYFGQSY